MSADEIVFEDIHSVFTWVFDWSRCWLVFWDTTPGGWCSSYEPAESSKPFASVRRAIRPGDSTFHISRITIFSSPYANVVMINNDVCRWTYIEFYSRYSILMSQQETVLSDKKQTCKNVLQRLIQVSLLFCCHQIQSCKCVIIVRCMSVLSIWPLTA